MTILIDTRPLSLSIKAPYYGEEHPVRALAMQAHAFVQAQLEQHTVASLPNSSANFTTS